MKKQITITGFGVCCSAGNNIDEVWTSLQKNEVSSMLSSQDFFSPHSPSPLFPVATKNILDLCDTFFLDQLDSKSLPGTNRTITLVLKAVIEACQLAKIPPDYLSSKRIGIAIGTTVGCTFHNEPYYINWKNGIQQKIAPVFTYLSSNIAERLQAVLRIHGPRAVVTNACASGTDAIGLAKSWLENDMCDIAIAGGGDELSRIACHGFSSLMLFSQDTCKPFDRQRQGLNLGEGAGILILEKQSTVDERKARPLGILRGYSSAGDAYHPTAPHPAGRGLQKAITMACRDASVKLSDVAYINAHGTGTQANDLAELTALQKLGVLQNNRPVIVSTKGATGHTLGAAGGIEAVITLKTLIEGFTAGTTGCCEQDPKLPVPVLRSGERAEINRKMGMSQSLAFGGSNSALILEAAV